MQGGGFILFHRIPWKSLESSGTILISKRYAEFVTQKRLDNMLKDHTVIIEACRRLKDFRIESGNVTVVASCNVSYEELNISCVFLSSSADVTLRPFDVLSFLYEKGEQHYIPSTPSSSLSLIFDRNDTKAIISKTRSIKDRREILKRIVYLDTVTANMVPGSYLPVKSVTFLSEPTLQEYNDFRDITDDNTVFSHHVEQEKRDIILDILLHGMTDYTKVQKIFNSPGLTELELKRRFPHGIKEFSLLK